MEYVGLDVHKKHIQACTLDESGNIVLATRFLNTQEELDAFLAKLSEGTRIVHEASSVWEHVHESAESMGFDVRLLNPLKTRAIAEAKVKTDKIDARTLAMLNLSGFIAECYVPDLRIRELRAILRHRAALTTMQTMLKNRVHALLAKENKGCPYADAFGVSGMKWLRSIELRESSRFAIGNFIEAQECIRELINKTSERIDELAEQMSEVALLDTIPGIATYSAMLIIAEIGDIKRFPSPEKLCSYAGLVPSVHQSGTHCYYGRITKQGSKWLRAVLIEASYHAIRKPNALSKHYRKLSAKGKGNKAIVAVARKMLRYIWVMLSESKKWDELRVNKAR